MLYLRNTNQQQTIDNKQGYQRGVANLCCSPTLDSVVTASLTQLTVNSTLGNYLVNCKSCVGEYLQVSENSGSTWTTINLGNCSSANLVPMPSQSAYYRMYTSCSANNQPFDPLTSSFSNEILFVPNSRLTYDYTETLSDGEFKIIVTGSTILDATSSISGTFYQIPSASAVSCSIAALSNYITGSTSMSLWITGSNVSYYTSSCVTSGSVFVGNYKAIPNEDYYVTASLTHRPNPSCGTNELTYTVDSFDPTTNRWYVANSQGTYVGQSEYSVITGSIYKSNYASGDCRYNSLYFSGSMSFSVSSSIAVYIGMITGSFTISGQAGAYPWSLAVDYSNTGSINLFNYGASNNAIKNGLVGFQLGTYVSPFSEREVSLYITGSNAATNPPTWAFGPYSLGTVATISGVGYIRSFGVGTPGTTTQQTFYNCLYESTPGSK